MLKSKYTVFSNVNNTNMNEVGLNKKVLLNFVDDDETNKYLIVTTVESDVLNDKISIESPLGKAIYKHKLGDGVMINSPDGQCLVRIEEIKTMTDISPHGL